MTALFASHADEIAAVVADFRTGRARCVDSRLEQDRKFLQTLDLISTATVVDATPIYHDLTAGGAPVMVYEDHTVRPPWMDASITYVNEHGNVVVMYAAYATSDTIGIDDWRSAQWETDADTHDIDWDQVKWIGVVSFWVGGRGRAGRIPTTGPLFIVRLAIHEDGSIADIQWQETQERASGRDRFSTALLVMLRCMTFLNCRNVTIGEPHRPRHLRRRIERHGVVVNELRITTAGKWARTEGDRPPAGEGVPLTTVRGHLARYGVEGRGLLFGKIAGTFWIPTHARGRADLGEHRNDYLVEGDA